MCEKESIVRRTILERGPVKKKMDKTGALGLPLLGDLFFEGLRSVINFQTQHRRLGFFHILRVHQLRHRFGNLKINHGPKLIFILKHSKTQKGVQLVSLCR